MERSPWFGELVVLVNRRAVDATWLGMWAGSTLFRAQAQRMEALHAEDIKRYQYQQIP
jgi:hypothetical protein